MKVTLNPDNKYVEKIKKLLQANDGYCPCAIEHIADTKCMCKDFKENIAIGEYCHCGLYKKLSS